jgi:hypothetical protein
MAASVIRRAVPEDLETLWDFLAMAAYEPHAAAAKAVPMIALFLDGWPRPGDFGFIAERDGLGIGAAWGTAIFIPRRVVVLHRRADA